jgi:hypothetical protein
MIYLGRTIDKVRASLPGGNLGSFIVGSDEVPTTMSLYLLRVLKTTEEEFREVVTHAESEDDVVAWVRAKAAPEKIARWNAWIGGYRVADLPPENVDFFFRSNATARGLSTETRVIDALDYEDSATTAMPSP